ncbi:tetratricopeptide repeat protein [Noviherbaspirillum autotrophicum]|nr:tetratricopeptide repeat protein [Noviherbaspirillum autotrophicum]
MKHLTSILFALILSTNAWALPPQIEADRLLLQAKTALDANDYEIAIQSFEKAAVLNVKMPDTFYFHFGKAYSGAKKWEKARAAYEQYLNQTGTRGKFYREALEGFNQADLEWTKAEKAYTDAMAKYTQEQNRYEANMRNCKTQEYDDYRKELEDRKERAWQKCQNYGKYGCMDGMSGSKALLEAAESASKRVWEFNEAPNTWCNKRYTAPSKPQR